MLVVKLFINFEIGKKNSLVSFCQCVEDKKIA
uniref:Uncharacterized protein n=1 Tax=Rhizophora mucronata TaxID=61149 RepID=A0A2P2P1H4_RHIMU